MTTSEIPHNDPIPESILTGWWADAIVEIIFARLSQAPRIPS